MTRREADAAARLLERLLTDAAFRQQFRQNPVATSREAGFTVGPVATMSGGTICCCSASAAAPMWK